MGAGATQRAHFTDGGCVPFLPPLWPPTLEGTLPTGRDLYLIPFFSFRLSEKFPTQLGYFFYRWLFNIDRTPASAWGYMNNDSSNG